MIADAVNELLDIPAKVRQMQKCVNMYVKGRYCPSIAKKYLQIFRQVPM
ncbi:MAG: hypothetical protein QXU32_04030 [Nitrososphaerales archaeon]